MAKQGAKIEKNVGKKKINHYTKAECEKEIARLDNMNKDKNSVNMGDSSKYKDEIKAHLATL